MDARSVALRLLEVKFNFPKREGVGEVVKVEKWYDRKSRSHVVQKKDAHGNQVGDAFYSGTREGADAQHAEWTKEHLKK